MKNTFKTLSLLAALGGALLCQSANAASITGGISLAGGPVTTDTGNLATASTITGFGAVTTTSTSGSYTPVTAGTVVTTTTGFTFKPILVPSPVINVWNFVFAGKTYSFDLYSIQSVSQGLDVNNNQFLNISGTGILHITGFTDTVGSYIFTANSAGGTFSFSSSNGAQVPDGGFTLALLGLALTGVEGLRRTLRK